MTTTELGPCEWFVWDLRRSNLIDRAQIDAVVGEFLQKHGRAEPPAVAQFLVDQGLLTPFQAERLLQGKSQGLVLGPYVLMDALGSGSMGQVYKALSKNDQQWYAVKVLPRRSMWNVRIARRQVRSFDSVHHPTVVPFKDVGTAGSTHYLAWPLAEGERLDRVVEREGRLSAGLATRFAHQIAEGMDACHRNGIVHGLLKPSNILIDADSEVRILDLGIGSILANSEGESLVDTMSTANSLTSGLDCASPESILEPTDRTPAGDQYSLGCLLYYMVTGRYPFLEETAVEKMMAHQTKRATPIKDLAPGTPDGLTEVVERLLAKEPKARYASMMEVAEALHSFVVDQPVERKKPVHERRPPAERNDPPRPSIESISPIPAPSDSVDIRRSAATPVSPRLENVTPADKQPLPRVKRNRPSALNLPQAGNDGSEAADDENLGPVGIVVGAVIAASLTWLISVWLFR